MVLLGLIFVGPAEVPERAERSFHFGIEVTVGSVWFRPGPSGLQGTRFLLVEETPLREDEGWFAEDEVGTFAWIVFFLVDFAFPGMLLIINLLSVRYEEV